MKAIVIGGGVVGASVTYRLAEAGVEVTMIEADYVGSGTSGTSFAWANANRKPPRPYYDLNMEGMRLHAALNEELGGDWFRVTGNVEWSHAQADRDAQRQRVERLQSWGYDARWIDRAELGKLEPDVNLDLVGDAQIAYFAQEGLVDPVRYAGALVRLAQSRWGTKVELGTRIVALEKKGSRVVGVKAADGRIFLADIVVNCAGRWVNDVTGNDPALAIPMAPTVGLLVYTPPVPATVKRPLHAPDINLRPDGAGRLMLRSNDADDTSTLESSRDPASPIALELMRRTAALLPCLEGVKPEAVRITLRSIPRDDISVVGTVPGVDGYYVCVTHSGVTLAPVLGKAAAEEITRNRTEYNLEIFRPDRFPIAA